MANLAKQLRDLETLYGETIEQIVVGRPYLATGAQDAESEILSREAGLDRLDREFIDGFDEVDCSPFWAWTASRVFFVWESDGAVGIAYVPRNPVAVEPLFSGRAAAFDHKAA